MVEFYDDEPIFSGNLTARRDLERSKQLRKPVKKKTLHPEFSLTLLFLQPVQEDLCVKKRLRQQIRWGPGPPILGFAKGHMSKFGNWLLWKPLVVNDQKKRLFKLQLYVKHYPFSRFRRMLNMYSLQWHYMKLFWRL